MLQALAVKVLGGLTIAFGLAVAGLGLHAYVQKQRLESAKLELASAEAKIGTLADELERAQALRKLDQAALALARREKAAIAREMASLRLSLDAALAANRAWAEQPVPKEVQDALSQP